MNPTPHTQTEYSRRELLKLGCLGASATALGTLVTGCEKVETPDTTSGSGNRNKTSVANEEYVWLSANANLPLFTAHDHPALRLAGEELGVKVIVAGPNTVDIAGLVAAVEQTAARKPAGMMVVGWDPSALVPAINKALAMGIPTITVDADVPESKRLCFVGTDWTEIGKRQAEAMLSALNGRKGKVAMIGLVGLHNMESAFAGFRTVLEQAGLTVLGAQSDKGNQAEAARVAAGILQAHDDLIGFAGFDSESGPGLGQAIKEAGRAGKIVATCVDAEETHLRLVKEGVLTACVGQKRELFTYYGVKMLYDTVHSPVRISSDDRNAGIHPIPININTGTYTVTRDKADLFLKA